MIVVLWMFLASAVVIASGFCCCCLLLLFLLFVPRSLACTCNDRVEWIVFCCWHFRRTCRLAYVPQPYDPKRIQKSSVCRSVCLFVCLSDVYVIDFLVSLFRLRFSRTYRQRSPVLSRGTGWGLDSNLKQVTTRKQSKRTNHCTYTVLLSYRHHFCIRTFNRTYSLVGLNGRPAISFFQSIPSLSSCCTWYCSLGSGASPCTSNICCFRTHQNNPPSDRVVGQYWYS